MNRSTDCLNSLNVSCSSQERINRYSIRRDMKSRQTLIPGLSKERSDEKKKVMVKERSETKIPQVKHHLVLNQSLPNSSRFQTHRLGNDSVRKRYQTKQKPSQTLNFNSNPVSPKKIKSSPKKIMKYKIYKKKHYSFSSSESDHEIGHQSKGEDKANTVEVLSQSSDSEG